MTIVPRKGKFQVRKMVGGRKYTKTFSTRKLASLYEKKLELDHEMGIIGIQPAASSATLREAGEFWVDQITLELAESTVKSYTYRWHANVIPALGGVPIGQVRPEDLDDFFVSRLRSGATPNDVDRDRMMLGSFFSWCIRKGLIAASPVKRTRRLRYAPTRPRRILSDGEVERCLSVLRPVSRLSFLVAVYTGIRAGEACRLRWDDVDLERRVLTVRSLKRDHTKTYRSRQVRIHPRLYDALRKTRRRGPFVLGTSKGNGRSRYFQGIIEQCEKKARVAHFTWHDLRHTFATRLRRNGVPLEDVGALLGHTDPKSTLIYAHADDRNLAAAVDGLP